MDQSRAKAVFLALSFLGLLVASISSAAQKARQLSQVKTVYVESLGNSRRSEEVRNHLIRRLEHNHEFQVVNKPGAADAVMKGTAEIWTTGEVSLSPHSHSATEPLLEGYLSIEVVGRNDQTLWSYLATPSRFPWVGVADDLARQVVARLGDDVRRSGHKPESSESTATLGGATLTAAGGTFPAPLYQKWFQSFEELHPQVRLSYDAVGSGEGIRRVNDSNVDFGASDMPLSDEALKETPRQIVEIPVVLGAVVPIYNIPNLHQPIRFTPEILAAIYLGKITNWNDPAIQSANPQADLPSGQIVVVHRSDDSGTSFVWTNYLSMVSAQWKSQVGSGIAVHWPGGVGAAYNEGVAATVQRTPNSIGYVELIYAIQHELSYAAVRNSAGEFVKADIASVTEAARAANSSDRGFPLSITNSSGKYAYPIASYTWLLIPRQIEDKNKRITLLELVRWMLSSGQKSCSALGYVPLPPDIAKTGLAQIENLLSN
jgi:phosphate transport system substrate-binding protein